MHFRPIPFLIYSFPCLTWTKFTTPQTVNQGQRNKNILNQLWATSVCQFVTLQLMRASNDSLSVKTWTTFQPYCPIIYMICDPTPSEPIIDVLTNFGTTMEPSIFRVKRSVCKLVSLITLSRVHHKMITNDCARTCKGCQHIEYTSYRS